MMNLQSLLHRSLDSVELFLERMSIMKKMHKQCIDEVESNDECKKQILQNVRQFFFLTIKWFIWFVRTRFFIGEQIHRLGEE